MPGLPIISKVFSCRSPRIECDKPGIGYNNLLDVIVLFILLVSISPSIAQDDWARYKGPDLSFEYPANWSVSSNSGYPAGDTSIIGSCAHISISWIRDPGIEPEKVLSQISKAYSTKEVSILKSKLGRTEVQGYEVQTLNMSYRLRDTDAQKKFAVWVSERSDRLFIASFSSCPDQFAENSQSFKRLLKSFYDNEDKETILIQREWQSDPWQIILSDLLSSYHYKDGRTLSSGAALYAQVSYTLKPGKGSYQLSSEENFSEKPSVIDVARAGAVLEILKQSGYDARLIQRSGRIWVIVRDPSGKWQPVSVNPSAPYRYMGVLTNGTDGCRGLVYENISELRKENPIMTDETNHIIPYSQIVQKDCDPSRYVELKSPTEKNETWIKGLQTVLDSYSYPKKYKANVFDCSNTSQICWSVLTGKGYDSRLMFSWKGHPLGEHMWVVVRYPFEEERYTAVEATTTDKDLNLVHLGQIVDKKEYYEGIMYNSSEQFSRLHPEEGLSLAIRSK